MSRSNTLPLKDAINRLMETYRLKTKINETRIIAQWEQLMGKTIARYTKQIYIKNKKLFLQIDSAPLRQELSFSKEKILEVINKEAGENIVEEVVFY